MALLKIRGIRELWKLPFLFTKLYTNVNYLFSNFQYFWQPWQTTLSFPGLHNNYTSKTSSGNGLSRLDDETLAVLRPIIIPPQSPIIPAEKKPLWRSKLRRRRRSKKPMPSSDIERVVVCKNSNVPEVSRATDTMASNWVSRRHFMDGHDCKGVWGKFGRHFLAWKMSRF